MMDPRMIKLAATTGVGEMTMETTLWRGEGVIFALHVTHDRGGEGDFW